MQIIPTHNFKGRLYTTKELSKMVGLKKAATQKRIHTIKGEGLDFDTHFNDQAFWDKRKGNCNKAQIQELPIKYCKSDGCDKEISKLLANGGYKSATQYKAQSCCCLVCSAKYLGKLRRGKLRGENKTYSLEKCITTIKDLTVVDAWARGF